MINKMIYHVKQEVVEYYEWIESLKSFKNINKYDGMEWERNSFDYIELIHSQDKNKEGLYGMYISW